MSQSLNIIIVEKDGNLKLLAIKNFKLEELYKKCGFKKSDDFIKHVEWNARYDGKKYFIEVYGKKDGRANSENKYDFPPPIDNVLFFGNCAILAYLKKENNEIEYTDISLPLWNKVYEKLFGGFEDLAATALEDEEEEDELANIPKEKKTKQGYLKDGFVVDSSDTEETNSNEEVDLDDDEDEFVYEESDELADDDEIVIDDLGSELSEESYDYETEEEDKEKKK
jgi:hypothetical protein